jgi:hypothetical protein
MGAQMVLDLFPAEREPLTATGIHDVGLKLGVFYYCLRERQAGRSFPVPLTQEQREFVDRWVNS